MLEAILHPADAIGHKRKPGAVEDRFLNAGDEAEMQVLAYLANLHEEVEIKDKLLISSCPEEIEKFIHNQEQTVIRKLLVERRHHFLEGAFVL